MSWLVFMHIMMWLAVAWGLLVLLFACCLGWTVIRGILTVCRLLREAL
jgi:hypothetical protein